jgi:hypothetical protein
MSQRSGAHWIVQRRESFNQRDASHALHCETVTGRGSRVVNTPSQAQGRPPLLCVHLQSKMSLSPVVLSVGGQCAIASDTNKVSHTDGKGRIYVRFCCAIQTRVTQRRESTPMLCTTTCVYIYIYNIDFTDFMMTHSAHTTSSF